MRSLDSYIRGRLRTMTKAREDFQSLNHRLMREEARKLGEKLRDGQISPAQFQTGLEKELKNGAVAAYRFAIARKFDDDDIARVNAILTRQAGYLKGFLADIEAKEPGDWIAGRAELYAGVTTEARAEGTLTKAGDDAPLTWQGPDGAPSCADCLSLIGTTRTAAAWRESGQLPSQVACLGNCRCWLERGSAS